MPAARQDAAHWTRRSPAGRRRSVRPRASRPLISVTKLARLMPKRLADLGLLAARIGRDQRQDRILGRRQSELGEARHELLEHHHLRPAQPVADNAVDRPRLERSGLLDVVHGHSPFGRGGTPAMFVI